MLAQTDDASRNDPQYLPDVAGTQFDPDQTPRDGAPNDIAALLRELVNAYGRAVQCLRDVRHRLPPDAVAIVDGILDCAAV
jgi:hypothetical protein